MQEHYKAIILAASLAVLLCVVLPNDVDAAEGDVAGTGVVEFDGTVYDTLEEAFEQVDADDLGMSLTADVKLADTLVFDYGYHIALDLNGNDIIAPEGKTAIVITNGDLEITDSSAELSVDPETYNVMYTGGKITSSETAVILNGSADSSVMFRISSGMVESTGNCGVYVNGNLSPEGSDRAAYSSVALVRGTAYIEAREYGVGVGGSGARVTVSDDAYVHAQDNAAVAGNGTNSETACYGDTEIEIIGGTLVSDIITSGYISCGIFHPQRGTLEIRDTTIVSNNGVGVLMRGGSILMESGTIIALGEGTGKVGNSTIINAGVGILADFQSDYYDGDNITVSVVSGTITSASEDAIGYQGQLPENKTALDVFFITGGMYSSDVLVLTSSGFASFPDGDGYVVEEGSKVTFIVNGEATTCPVHNGSDTVPPEAVPDLPGDGDSWSYYWYYNGEEWDPDMTYDFDVAVIAMPHYEMTLTLEDTDEGPMIVQHISKPEGTTLENSWYRDGSFVTLREVAQLEITHSGDYEVYTNVKVGADVVGTAYAAIDVDLAGPDSHLVMLYLDDGEFVREVVPDGGYVQTETEYTAPEHYIYAWINLEDGSEWDPSEPIHSDVAARLTMILVDVTLTVTTEVEDGVTYLVADWSFPVGISEVTMEEWRIDGGTVVEGKRVTISDEPLDYRFYVDVLDTEGNPGFGFWAVIDLITGDLPFFTATFVELNGLKTGVGVSAGETVLPTMPPALPELPDGVDPSDHRYVWRDQDGNGLEVPITKDVTFTPVLEEIVETYEVEFVSPTVVLSVEVPEGGFIQDIPALPDAPEHYLYLWLDSEGNGPSTSVPVTGDLTYTATLRLEDISARIITESNEDGSFSIVGYWSSPVSITVTGMSWTVDDEVSGTSNRVDMLEGVHTYVFNVIVTDMQGVLGQATAVSEDFDSSSLMVEPDDTGGMSTNNTTVLIDPSDVIIIPGVPAPMDPVRAEVVYESSGISADSSRDSVTLTIEGSVQDPNSNVVMEAKPIVGDTPANVATGFVASIDVTIRNVTEYTLSIAIPVVEDPSDPIVRPYAYYFNEMAGYLESVDCRYDSETGTVEILTDHNTDYYVYLATQSNPGAPDIPVPDTGDDDQDVDPGFNPGWNDDDDYVPLPPVVITDDGAGRDNTAEVVACAAAAVVAALMAAFLIIERRKG